VPTSRRRSTWARFFFELTGKAGGLLRDVHRIATAYHWSEPQVWDLPLSRRLAYLLQLEADADAALLAGLAPVDLEWSG
jgi:hypothetical protein